MAKAGEQRAAEAAATDASAPSAPAAAQSDDKRTPDEWAAQCFPPSGTKLAPRLHASLWQHAAAGALHGWAEHEHHAGAPMRVSGEDYFQALVAASAPDSQGHYRPHPGALSPHARAGKG